MKRLQRTLYLRNGQLFRYLPYWKDFEIGHANDTMHVEKDVFESTIGLLLDISGNMKDGLNSRKGLQVLRIT
jgi:hypothetical protein